MLEVRQTLGPTSELIRGIFPTETALRGRVLGCAPGVMLGLEPGDEVLFRRPEGPLPEVTFVSEDQVLAVLTYPTYGEDS